jgi:hypothetical protein
MKSISIFTRYVMLLMCIFLLGACAATPPQAAPATSTALLMPTPTPYVPPPTPVPPLLGPVPQNCPLGPTPQHVFSDVGPVLGHLPVWAIGFDGPHAVVRLSSYFTYTQYGWTWKILWRVSDSSPSPITLQAGPLGNRPLLWFQIGDQNPTVSPTLAPVTPDPAYLTVTNAPWTDFPSYFFIPKAGCYYLEAHWRGGSWRITFAAGA